MANKSSLSLLGMGFFFYIAGFGAVRERSCEIIMVNGLTKDYKGVLLH